MKLIFDFITSPLGLPINPLYEYVILGVIGIIAFAVAYILAGRWGHSPSERSGFHWFIRIVVFVVLWALTKLGIYFYWNPRKGLLILGIVFGVIILLVGIFHVIWKIDEKKNNSAK